MKSSTLKDRSYRWGVIFLWLIIWQGIYIYIGKDVFFPSPINTLKEFFYLCIQPSFYLEVISTVRRVILGVSISTILGIVSAILAYFIVWIRVFLKPLMTVLKSTPVMAIAIIALLWFSSSNVPIFVCFMMCYPIIYTNVLQGFLSIDKELIEMSHVFEVNKLDLIKEIYIPHALPYIKSALRLILGIAWKAVVTAEVLSIPKHSMGYNLLNSKNFLETEKLFAWVMAIIILSSLSEKILDRYLFKENKNA